jgi:hypothetical protein
MNTLIGSVHLIAGNAHDVDTLIDQLEGDGLLISGNPDAFVRSYAHFGVEEARELRERANSRAMTDSGRIFLIATPVMTTEAQNALLKTLEEPADLSTFFIVVPSPDMLLATLRSRTQPLALSRSAPIAFTVDPLSFLKATPSERLDMLKPLLDKDTDDRRDIASVISFLAGLEQVLASAAQSRPDALAAIYRARSYVTDKGALVKPLLEQVALLA